MPKEYTIGGKLSEDEIDLILKAANWAPTHQKSMSKIHLKIISLFYNNKQFQPNHGDIQLFQILEKLKNI